MKYPIILVCLLIFFNVLLADNQRVKPKPILWVLYGQYPMGTEFTKDDFIESKNDIEPIILISNIEGFIVIRQKGSWWSVDLYDKLVAEKSPKNPFPEVFVGEINPLRDNLLKTGVIERCDPPPTISCVPIGGNIFFDKYTINWLRNSDNKDGFNTYITNSFDEVLESKITQDTCLTFDTNKYIKNDFGLIKVSSCINGKTSSSCSCPLVYSFFYPKADKLEKLKIDFYYFSKSLQKSPKVLQYLHQGIWFYKNDFFLDAFQHYSKAHKLFPKSKVLYFVLGEILSWHSYHYPANKVFPNWRKIL
jgi:hypothetical protein